MVDHGDGGQRGTTVFDGRHQIAQDPAQLQRGAVGPGVDLGGRVEREHQLVVRLLDAQVLLQHLELEGHGLGHARLVAVEVVPPQGREQPARLVGLGLNEEADDVGAAGVDEVDAQPEMERRAQPIGEAPRLDERAHAGRHPGVLAVGEGVLVGHGEGPVVAGHGELGHLGRLVGAECAGVDEGEVGDVEEVVRQQTRRAPGAQRRELPFQEGDVVGLRDGAEWGDGRLGREEDDAVRLRHRRGGRQPGGSGAASPPPPAPGSRHNGPTRRSASRDRRTAAPRPRNGRG